MKNHAISRKKDWNLHKHIVRGSHPCSVHLSKLRIVQWKTHTQKCIHQTFFFNSILATKMHTQWFCECCRIGVVSQMCTHCYCYICLMCMCSWQMSFFFGSVAPDECMMVQCYNWGKTCVRAVIISGNASTPTENCNPMCVVCVPLHTILMQHAKVLFNEFGHHVSVFREKSSTRIQIHHFFQVIVAVCAKPKFNISTNLKYNETKKNSNLMNIWGIVCYDDGTQVKADNVLFSPLWSSFQTFSNK